MFITQPVGVRLTRFVAAASGVSVYASDYRVISGTWLKIFECRRITLKSRRYRCVGYRTLFGFAAHANIVAHRPTSHEITLSVKLAPAAVIGSTVDRRCWKQPHYTEDFQASNISIKFMFYIYILFSLMRANKAS